MKISRFIFCTFILFFLDSRATEACPSFHIYYIPLDRNFFVPPIPVEKNALKEFDLKDCDVEKLFASFEKCPKTERDEKLARIKIVRLSDSQSLLIDQEGSVLRNNMTCTILSKVTSKAIKKIQTKAEPKH